MTPRLQRARLATLVAAAAAGVSVATHNPANASDFMQLWVAAGAWQQGIDPYSVVGPNLTLSWAFPLLYPMPAVLVAVPFSWFPIMVADALFVAIGFFALAWAVTRTDLHDPRLAVFLSLAGILAARNAQWAPLLCAAALTPGMGFLLACKPTLGLAFLIAYPSWRTAFGMASFALVSLIAWPSWPWQWLENLPTATHMSIPIIRPGGFLILAALARWRDPGARLLVALACIPQTPVLYEAVPLFLLVKTWRDGWILSALTAGQLLTVRLTGPHPDFYSWMDASATAMLWWLYIPCTAMVLWPLLQPLRIRRPAW